MNNRVAAASADYDGDAEGGSPGSAGTSPAAAAAALDIGMFKAIFRDAPYFSTGRAWSDYVPAYQYGRDAYGQHQALRFEDVEDALEQGWDAYKPPSRLAWAEARGAVEHAWQLAREAAHAPIAGSGGG